MVLARQIWGKTLVGVGVSVLTLVFAVAGVAQTASGSQQVLVKKAIADAMTPSELAVYKSRLAERVAARGARDIARSPLDTVRTGQRLAADTCAATTPEISVLPYGPVADTTVGQTDDYDLPTDATAPTCTASTTCMGAGMPPSLPRGAIYTGTGTGPDRAYELRVDVDCTVAITMDPTTSEDLALIVYESTCSSLLSDCVCVDDTGDAGVPETVTVDAVAGTTYYVVIDGYSIGAAPPGSSGPFTLSVTETTTTGCILVPVELQSFSVN
jgi:hypothetical protein